MVKLNFQLALTSVPYDNTYKNVLRFDTREEQEAHFKTDVLFLDKPYVNFNTGSLLQTNVVYDCQPTEDLNTLLNQNYLIVKDNSATAKLKYYYYFVTNAIQLAGERIQMSIELDIFQTYYIDLNFTECLINKAHLNRFIENEDGTVSFDGRPESLLFTRENIQNVGKRLTKRTVKSPCKFENKEIEQWFENNILGWVYIFIDNYHTYKVKQPKTGEDEEATILQLTYGNASEDRLTNKWDNGLPEQLGVLCYPVYKTTQSRTQANIYAIDKDNDTIEIGHLGAEDFFMNNNQDQYVFSKKFSTINPFANLINNSDLYIENNNLYIPINSTLTGGFHGGYDNTDLYILCSYYSQNHNNSGLMEITIQRPNNDLEYTTNKQFTFNKKDIITDNKNYKYNPKLYNTDYFELKISDETENGYVYDLQKLNTNKFEIQYTEPLIAGISKKYIRILPPENSVYIKQTANNYTGFISSNDMSFTLSTSAYQNMLANNKNYFLQNSINRSFNYISGISNIAGQLIKEQPNIIGAVGTVLNTGLNYAESVINQNLTIDNLKASPSTIQLAQGDVTFNIMSTEVGVIIEEWEILEEEKQQINDFMCLYGFSFNQVANIKDYDNIRKYYNYIRADIEQIDGLPISNAVHDKFIQVFKNGVRFWNTDTFDYSKENYERWLENE